MNKIYSGGMQVAAVIALALGLTACSSTPSATSTSTSTAAPTTEPTSTSTSAPVETTAPAEPSIKAGDVLTGRGSTMAAKDAGFGVYEFNDGTKMVVNPNQDLPAPVVAEVKAAATAAYVPDGGYETNGALMSQASSLSNDTGKHVIIIAQSHGSKDGSTWQNLWAAYSAPMFHNSASADINEVITNAEAHIASQPDKATWEIVIADPAK